MAIVAVPSAVAKFTDDVIEVSPDLVTVKSKFLVPEPPSASVTSFMDMPGSGVTEMGCQFGSVSETVLLVSLVTPVPSGLMAYNSKFPSLLLANKILVPSGDQAGPKLRLADWDRFVGPVPMHS